MTECICCEEREAAPGRYARRCLPCIYEVVTNE